MSTTEKIHIVGIGENAERNADGSGESGEDRRDAMIAALTTEDPEEIEASGLRRFRVMAGNELVTEGFQPEIGEPNRIQAVQGA